MARTRRCRSRCTRTWTNPLTLYARDEKKGKRADGAHVCEPVWSAGHRSCASSPCTVPFGRPDMALFLFTKNILAGKPIDVFNYGHHKRDLHLRRRHRAGRGACDGPRPRSQNSSWNGDQPDPGTSKASVPALQHRQPAARRAPALHRSARGLPRAQKRRRTCCRCSSATCPTRGADVEDLVTDVGYRPSTPVEVGRAPTSSTGISTITRSSSDPLAGGDSRAVLR